MTPTPKIWVLLPAYNEAEALSILIPDIRTTLASKGPFEIILVDDGSSDDTLRKSKGWGTISPVKIISHPKNRGYGAALLSGYVWAIQNAQATDIVASLDADNTHQPSYISELVAKIEAGFDVVTASYAMAGGRAEGVPFLRRLMSLAANTLFRLFLPIQGARCYTNGFRAYRASALQAAYQRYGARLIENTGFPGGTELFVKVCRLGACAAEVPFTLYYQNRGKASKIRFGNTILGYLNLIQKLRRLPR